MTAESTALQADSPYVVDISDRTASVYDGAVSRTLLFTTDLLPGKHIVRTAVARTAVGQGGEPHHHPDTDEYYYVLTGQAHVVIAGREHHVGPGSLVHVPCRTTHRMANGGDTELTYLAFHVADAAFDGAVEHVGDR